MKIQSGSITNYVYFVAVDATDLKTRETGLSSFTVYRSRNGTAAAAMTTPTINEVDPSNMPGVYELLLDEDTTATEAFEELVFHITHAGMAPVTRTVEIHLISAADTTKISGDSTAADNLELDYDGTGYNKLNSTIGTTTTNTDMVSVSDVLTTQMTEAYAADGTSPTLAQALFNIQQTLGDFSITGTTITVKKLDGATTAMTYTLDDATTPTSRTRAT